MVKDSINTLILRIAAKPRRRWLSFEPSGLSADEIERRRAEMSLKFQDLSSDEQRCECLNGACQWLGVTLAVNDSDRVMSVTRTEYFVVLVLYLDALVNAWTQDKPSRGERDCVQAVVDLLLRVESQGRQRFSAVQEELVAAFLLCCALRGLMVEYLASRIQNDLRDELLEGSQLYQWLKSKDGFDLGEAVKKVSRLHLE